MANNSFLDKLNNLNEQLAEEFTANSLDWYLKNIRDLYADYAMVSEAEKARYRVIAPSRPMKDRVRVIAPSRPMGGGSGNGDGNNGDDTGDGKPETGKGKDPTGRFVPLGSVLNVIDSPTPILIGSMLMYTYDPKLKAKLPYYDTFPLVFMINHYGNSFLGINLHYLPLRERAMLFDALVNTLLNTKDLDETSRLTITYNILKVASRFQLYKPCIKKYLLNHIRSRIMVVNPKDWDKVMMMPLARFMKTSQEKVWQDSINMVKR